jgi:hypothetical protein
MADQAGLIKRFDQNFVLDETKLRRVAAILAEYRDKLSQEAYIQYYVERENDSYWETRSVDDVLSDDNAVGREIRVVNAAIYPDPDKPTSHAAVISFARYKETRISIGIAHENRDWCFLLGDDLDAQARRCLKPRPLKLLTTRAADNAFVSVVWMSLLVWALWLAMRQPPEYTDAEILRMTVPDQTRAILRLAVKRDQTNLWVPFVMFLIPVVWFVSLEARPISRLFKRIDQSVFYWGDAAPRFDLLQERLTWAKWGVGVAFVVSVAASVVAAWLLGT